MAQSEVDESQEPFLPSSKYLRGHKTWRDMTDPKRPKHSLIISFLFVSLIVSALFNVTGIWMLFGMSNTQTCSCSQSRIESPILDHVAITYSEQRFDGNLSSDTIYRRPGSVAVGQAWEELGSDYRPFVVPESDAERYGLDSRMVKVAPQEGGGYAVVSWAMLNMHCLNLIRRTSKWEYDYYKEIGFDPFKESDEYLHNYTTLCVNVIRQQLMCAADTGVMGLWWTKEKKMAPDLNSRHQCKNYEDIRRYAEQNQIPASGGLFAFRPGDLRLETTP